MVDRHKQLTPYPLRIPSDMRAELQTVARENDRTLHAEILRRLKESLPSGGKAVQTV